MQTLSQVKFTEAVHTEIGNKTASPDIADRRFTSDMYSSKPISYVNTFSSQTYHSYPYKNIKQDKTAISTFSPISLLSSNGLRMRVGVCTGTAWNELVYSVGMPA